MKIAEICERITGGRIFIRLSILHARPVEKSSEEKNLLEKKSFWKKAIPDSIFHLFHLSDRGYNERGLKKRIFKQKKRKKRELFKWTKIRRLFCSQRKSFKK